MKKEINGITLGGIFSACYAILTALFVYALPVLSTISMIVLPIFSAYYSTKYKFKFSLLFNLAAIIVSFLVGLGDPFYCILYVIPSLLIGDVFGLLNHLKIKFYATVFFQALTFTILNYLTIYLAEIFYETSIMKFVIPDEFVYNNFGLCILFVISLAEAIVCTLFVINELKKLKIDKEIEKDFPLYGYILLGVLFCLATTFSFINNNFYYLFGFLLIIVAILAFIPYVMKVKHKDLLVIISSFSLVLLCLGLAYFNLEKYIVLFLGFSLSIISLLSFIKKPNLKN